MDYPHFFTTATGWPDPFPYQSTLASDPWPDLLNVPTGMGKTAAVTLAWLWKRGWRIGPKREGADPETPRRLVWCLPMRVLVEQAEENIRAWLKNLAILGSAGTGNVSVHVLMGGADNMGWASFPEEDTVLVGTQDMLLSRALMRGYGMSRYQWPVHFALLHNDCLWVFDEVQLMGAGLATAAQLEAFRRSLPLAKPSRSLWVSATLNKDWLDTVDFKPHLANLTTMELDESDYRQGAARIQAVKAVRPLGLTFNDDAHTVKGLERYIESLSAKVMDLHDANSQTIVILNRVERAQGLFRYLRKLRPNKGDLLIHARFRAAERRAQNCLLRNAPAAVDRIVIATQAIEAGVDISSKVLITELAPWASLVQRFGRCNRYGEHNAAGASIFWVDMDDEDELLSPYNSRSVASARTQLASLTSASTACLAATGDPRPLSVILRRKDLLDLFNTDPDLSGFDVDVSDYIRDTDSPGAQVFWREFGNNPNEPMAQDSPNRDELCPISMSQARNLDSREVWYWDTLGDEKRDGRWTKLDSPRPGMVLLFRASNGGYDPDLGFDAKLKTAALALPLATGALPESSYGDDWRSRQKFPVPLVDHLGHVAEAVTALCLALNQQGHADALFHAGLWHDLGKTHPVFDATMHACNQAPAGFLAKSCCNGKHQRRFFRHELASALAWLAQHEGEPDSDLVAYLIAAHHGKVRMRLRAMPTEAPAPGERRFARGIWEGDTLPALDFHGHHSRETSLQLALMELGRGEQGKSWMERALLLLQQHGPFRLAWLEALVVMADWRASNQEQSNPSQQRI